MHIHLTVLQQSCLKMTTKQQRGLRSIEAIKNHQNNKYQYFVKRRQIHLQQKKKNDVPRPPQLSPKMLPKAPGIPQDPADLQGTPQVNVLRSHFQ